MSENRNRETRDFSEYDSMSTEELESILRLDSEAPPELESDTELILHIMEVLANRTTKNNTGKTALESWRDFQQNYLCEDEENVESTIVSVAAPKLQRHWLRRLGALAAALALVIGLAATASAIEWEALWNAVAHWANDTFSFVVGEPQETTNPSPQSTLEYNSLQEALKLTGKEYDFVPTWIPKGYHLEYITADENPIQCVYIAQYKNGERDLIITVRIYPDGDPEKVEINNELEEIYPHDGVDYYIFCNMEQYRAVWVQGSYECYISGELTIEELKMMIDSIGKG